jgi:hypothetical protein
LQVDNAVRIVGSRIHHVSDYLADVPVLSAGYLQTAVSITCHEPQHRAFITSVRLCRRQMQRRGILSFLQVHTIRAYQSAMWGFTAETGS